MTQPNPLPIKNAATAPIGGQGGSHLPITAELLIGIAIPIIVPALILAMARIIAVTDGGQALRLDELAFGFAGVAIASLVRAASLRDWSWPGFIIFAALILLWFAVLGVAVNRESGVDEIVDQVHSKVEGAQEDLARSGGEAEATEFLANLRALEATRLDAEPDGLTWTMAMLPGLLFVGLAWRYIIKVRH